MRQVLKKVFLIGAATGAFYATAHADTISVNPNIPGVESPTDLVSIVVNFYQFALLTGAVLAFASIVYGAVNYALSESVGTKNDAKDRIVDAFIGLVLLAGAYLLLYTINPALTIFTNPGLEKISEITTAKIPAGGIVPGSGGSGPGGSGKCTPITNTANECSVAKLAQTCFGSAAESASKVCNAESSGEERNYNKSLYCGSGNYIIWGLFQINLNANNLEWDPSKVPCNTYTTAKQSGSKCVLECSSAISGSNTNCSIANQAVYNDCVKAAQNPAINIETACKLKNASGWSPWEVSHAGYACYGKV